MSSKGTIEWILLRVKLTETISVPSEHKLESSCFLELESSKSYSGID